MKEVGIITKGWLPKVVTFLSGIYYNKVRAKVAIFCKILVLLTYFSYSVFAQLPEDEIVIELGPSNFPIERPYLISVIISNSNSRPAIDFPDIPGFVKKGISRSVTSNDASGKTVTNQIITQSYQARAPGRFRLAPFTITIDDEVARSEGANLVVQPSVTSGPASLTEITAVPEVPGKELAFLSLQTSRNTIYSGESLALTLSFFVADNYPYTLNFKALDQQLQTITKKIRPANTWEENLNITELKPVQILIKGKRFRQFRLYQSIFFPLSSQRLTLPAVSLWLTRQPMVGPPTAEGEKIAFTSRPVTVMVRPLPPHPLRGRVPVGQFSLQEGLERGRITLGKSVRYALTINGEGNIAGIPAPTLLAEGNELDIFPPEAKQTVNHFADRVMGSKTFTYFIVPHQNGTLPLANRFQWIYFDPKIARYDTLQPNLQLRVGGSESAVAEDGSSINGNMLDEEAPVTTASNSLYAGIETMDSTRQQIRLPVLVRAVANVLLVLMLLGMVFMFFKK
jgi:hypothetical protein